jgi:hypothetical protein
MNKSLTIIIMLTLVITIAGCGGKATRESSTTQDADGSAEKPFLIFTAAHLNEIRNGLDKHYIMMEDIDMAGHVWEQLGTDGNPFRGTLDGKGHTISNLVINSIGDFQGLFGIIGSQGIVHNLGLKEVKVTGLSGVGGLAGYNLGTITNSYVTGRVSGNNSTGGLVGLNYGTITDCYAMVGVNGNYYLGGLVGLNNGAVTNCYAKGGVSGSYSTGGLVGQNDAAGTIIFCYYDKQTSGQSDEAGRGTPMSTEQMKLQSTYVGWDFDSIWRIDEDVSYPELR